MKSTKPGKNEFFDINKLPPEKGLLLFGLSMNKLANRQSAKNCLKDIFHFTPSRVQKPLIGLNFIYSDFLYLYSDESAPVLKEKFMNQVIQHKNSMERVIWDNYLDLQIQHAFNYMTWNQLYVGTRDFNEMFMRVKKIYENDKKFQEYMKKDCKIFSKDIKENQINFFLEEILMFYLLTHNMIKLPNDYVENNQKWILFCYPGRPISSCVYLYQLNPFNLEWSDNPYQKCFYDLESKQLIKYEDVDLETYSIK